MIVSAAWADKVGGQVPVVPVVQAPQTSYSPQVSSPGPVVPSSDDTARQMASRAGSRTNLALSRARRATAPAARAERIAQTTAARNRAQASHGHKNRDYGTTVWQHLWGEKSTSDDTRRICRENGGLHGLLWGIRPPTEEEFRSFSGGTGLVGATVNNQSRLDYSRVSLWLLWIVVGLLAFVMTLLHIRRSTTTASEESEGDGIIVVELDPEPEPEPEPEPLPASPDVPPDTDDE